jgi:hypothetical protein
MDRTDGGLDLDQVFRPLSLPHVSVEVAFVDEKVREEAICVLVDDVGCFSAGPRQHGRVGRVRSDKLPDRALPVIAREPWQCRVESGEQFKYLIDFMLAGLLVASPQVSQGHALIGLTKSSPAAPIFMSRSSGTLD